MGEIFPRPSAGEACSETGTVLDAARPIYLIYELNVFVTPGPMYTRVVRTYLK